MSTHPFNVRIVWPPAVGAARLFPPVARAPIGRKVEGRPVPFDPRDRVYELRRRAAELRDQAKAVEAAAWGLDRDLRRARRRR